jgi:hypothetical protein
MRLEQDDVRSSFEALGAGTWTTAYANWYKERTTNGGIYCAFAPISKRQEAVRDPGWDVTKGDFRPGFSQYHENDEWVTTYLPGSVRGEYEPLILVREYYGVAPSTLELVEQFRLYHNLYWDELTSQYMQPHDDGTSSVAVKVTGTSRVDVRTKLLRQYQAARQLDLLLFIDSVCLGEDGEQTPLDADWSTDVLRASRFSSKPETDGPPFTRYLGTRVLSPPPIEKSGI